MLVRILKRTLEHTYGDICIQYAQYSIKFYAYFEEKGKIQELVPFLLGDVIMIFFCDVFVFRQFPAVIVILFLLFWLTLTRHVPIHMRDLLELIIKRSSGIKETTKKWQPQQNYNLK